MIEPKFVDEKYNIKLYLGNCLDVMSKLGQKFEAVITDPPFGITKCKWDSVIDLEKMWGLLSGITEDNTAIVLNACQPFTTTLISSNPKLFKYCRVWKKNTPSNVLNCKKQPIRVHEDIVVFYGKQCIYNPQMWYKGRRTGIKSSKVASENYRETDRKTLYKDDGWRYPTSVIEIVGIVNNSKEKVKHPTQKPVALMSYLIKTYSNKGDSVLDFAMGSGTTGVAAIQENRGFTGIELDPEYFKISVERIKQSIIEAQGGDLFAEHRPRSLTQEELFDD